MKLRSLFVLGLLFVYGCASYKQLQPKPELIPAEQGFLELKKDKEQFKLGKNKQYYIAFPAPQQDNFYLVLTLPQKQQIHSVLADFFKGKKVGNLIAADELSNNERSVYPVARANPIYYWLVDSIKAELVLNIQYRYVPQWRFRFENKHDEYKKILENNLVDRSVYKNLGTSFHFAPDFNFGVTIDTVKRHATALDAVHQALLAIESIFPAGIVNSNDKAYLAYRDLRQKIEEEMQFQANYLAVLDAFDRMRKSAGRVPMFMANIDALTGYFGKKAEIAPNAIAESQLELDKRLADVGPYYESLMQIKADAAPLDSSTFSLADFAKLPALYTASGVAQKPAFSLVHQYVTDFDKNARSLNLSRAALDAIIAAVKNGPQMPPESFFKEIVVKMADLEKTVPPQMDAKYGKYQSFPATTALNTGIGRLATEVSTRTSQYRQAAGLVPQINGMAAVADYRAARQTLRQNASLDFLLDKYHKLDTLSVQHENSRIRDALSGYRWAEAEGNLRQLNSDQDFLFPANIIGMRDGVVAALEDSIYSTIDRVSRTKVDKFLLDNVDTLSNIDSLYTDSVFLPCYDVTFTTGSRADLAQRKTDLVAHLAKLKANEFPAKAITLLYDQFTKNPDDNGVLKARAIVAHGRHYTATGEDKAFDDKIRRRVYQVDPTAPKWITEPTKYTNVYVLPVTDKKRGTNKYMFRINIRIESDAQFPVYDVNLKLPKEVAQNAGTSQWYEKLTLNDQPLKNEGRFVITAPTAANDYECQITPVSVLKDKSNYLDVIFNHDSFKVLQASVMVQKPIIKKN